MADDNPTPPPYTVLDILFERSDLAFIRNCMGVDHLWLKTACGHFQRKCVERWPSLKLGTLPPKVFRDIFECKMKLEALDGLSPLVKSPDLGDLEFYIDVQSQKGVTLASVRVNGKKFADGWPWQCNEAARQDWPKPETVSEALYTYYFEKGVNFAAGSFDEYDSDTEIEAEFDRRLEEEKKDKDDFKKPYALLAPFKEPLEISTDEDFQITVSIIVYRKDKDQIAVFADKAAHELDDHGRFVADIQFNYDARYPYNHLKGEIALLPIINVERSVLQIFGLEFNLGVTTKEDFLWRMALLEWV